MDLWRGYVNPSSFEEFTLLARSRCAVYRVVEKGLGPSGQQQDFGQLALANACALKDRWREGI